MQRYILLFKNNPSVICHLIFLAIICSSFAFAKSLSINYAVADSVKPVFIRSISSKKNVYAGEAFTVKYLLYYSVSIINPQAKINLKFEDCDVVEYPDKQEQSKIYLQHKKYHVLVLKKYLVIAHKAGRLALPAIQLPVKFNSQSTTDNFFEQEKLVTKKLSSGENYISVQPLPVQNDTLPFSRAIGTFKIKEFFQPVLGKNNQLQFHLIIEGKGSTKAAGFIVPKLPPGISAFNITNNSSNILTEKGQITHYHFSYYLTANYRNAYKIPPVIFIYFNPYLKRYIDFKSNSYYWQVNTGIPIPKQFSTGVKDENTVSSRFLFVKNSLYANNEQPFSDGWHFFILLVTLSFVIVVIYNIESFSAFFNAASAKRRAIKAIENLISTSAPVSDNEFYKAMDTIFYDYLIQRKNPFAADIYKAYPAHLKLYQRISSKLQFQIEDFLMKQSETRFGYSNQIPDNRNYLCNKLIIIINALSKSLI